MVIAFALTFSLLSIALMAALYSSFLPYFSLLKDIKQYNMAYYGANTAIERSLLALKYHEPGFEGSSGRQPGSLNVGAFSDYLPSPSFGYYGPQTSLLRTIESRAINGKLPGSGNNQLSREFAETGSFGVLGYNQLLKIPLGADVSPVSDAYISGSANFQTFDKPLSLNFKLNSTVANGFSPYSELCDNAADGCDFDMDNVSDDAIISRQLNGKYKNASSQLEDFSVVPRSLVGFLGGGSNPVVFGDDETIRMSSLNLMTANPNIRMIFGSNFNPLYDKINSSTRTNHLMIGSAPLANLSFEDIFTNSDVSHVNVEFSLLGLLRTAKDSIYPFVQRQAQGDAGNNGYLSQPYYKITGSSHIGNYSVTMEYRKPIDSSYLESFTAIF